MTISKENTKKNHTGTGAVTQFAYDFLVLEESHLQVYVDDVIVSDTEYSVSGVGGDETGGEVTFNTAPANGSIVTLLRFVPYTQLVDYIDYARFEANTHERTLDLLTMACTQLQEQADRAMTASLSADTDLSMVLPSRIAGRALMWDDTEKKISNSASAFNTLVSQCNAVLTLCQAELTACEAEVVNCQTEVSNAAAQVALAAAQVALAVDAKTAAQTAQTNSESARDASMTYRDSSESHSLDAQAAQTAAEAARDVVLAFPDTANEWGATQRYTLDQQNPCPSAITLTPANNPSNKLYIEVNTTITLNDFAGDDSMLIYMQNTGTGGNTLTWVTNESGGIKWMAGADYSTGPESGEAKVFHFWSDGYRILGAIVWQGDI